MREKKDVFALKLLKVNLEGSGTARAEFAMETKILAQLQARAHRGECRGVEREEWGKRGWGWVSNVFLRRVSIID